ncbi:putative DNA repair protein XPGC [Klebsormidium nitens]|uniref:Putative DNA repair protein XPGC n=1 Tax=Klebsormidium nitens TaxID=105231 RepID=A0A0U9HKJ8_KLENI|nr:putative DNA repair protein XPGC [Klebsormidium nitens]|eukprot:GAQ80739.1 putative DNA repair protein XPGC [Klebsormidium nitens]
MGNYRSNGNQRVVVDLSCWIVECCGHRMPGVHARWQPHLHLQGIFHRLRALLALNCIVVCVADGDFDQLKRPTVTARLQGPLSQQQKDKASAERYAGGAASKRPQHSHFGRKVQEAIRLCEAMGIPCIRSTLDAEAQCAVLNAAGLFDACITTDSDAFLFGALKVYRTFKLDGQSGCDGVVEACTSTAVLDKLGFGRNSLIALGVFLGSDYHDGVKGVGVQKATRLVAQLGETQVLKTILRDGVQAVLDEGRPKNSKAKAGRATEGAEPPGDPSQIDDAAIATVIKAFLEPKVHAPTSDIVTRALQQSMELQLDSLIDLMQRYLDWEPDKTKSFILPKLAERCLRQRAARPHRNPLPVEPAATMRPLQYSLKQILKARTVKHVRSYEVSWEGSPAIDTTTVPAGLLERAFPNEVNSFKDAETAEKLRKKKSSGARKIARRRSTSASDALSAVLAPLPENVRPAANHTNEDSCLDLAELRLTGRPADRALSAAAASKIEERRRRHETVETCDWGSLSDEETEANFSWRGVQERISRPTSVTQAQCTDPRIVGASRGKELREGVGRGGCGRSTERTATKSTGRSGSDTGSLDLAELERSTDGEKFCRRSTWGDNDGQLLTESVSRRDRSQEEASNPFIDLVSDDEEESADWAVPKLSLPWNEEGESRIGAHLSKASRPPARLLSPPSLGSPESPPSIQSIIASIKLRPPRPAPTLVI